MPICNFLTDANLRSPDVLIDPFILSTMETAVVTRTILE